MIARWWRGGRGRSRAAARQPALERALLAAVQAGLLLLLVTPLVVTSSTYFPFIVGKALFARSVIEVVVALWAGLALVAPSYRPRRSLVLVLLGAGLAWSVVSAMLGASPQRSFWSNYERMQGVIDAAHWVALAMVVSCVMRRPGQWLLLLHGSLAVGLVVGLLAILQYFAMADVPLFDEFLRRKSSRPGSTLGNPIYLGAYMVLNAMLAFGLLVRSCVAAGTGAEQPPREPPGGEPPWRGRAQGRTRRLGNSAGILWCACCGALHLWAGILATSRGPLLGAVFGLMALAFVCVLLVRRRRLRVLGIGAVAAIALLGSSPLLIAQFAPPGFAKEFDSRVVRRLMRLDLNDRTVQTRWAAWKTGIEGLADRPLAGWGPENFLVVFAGYSEGLPVRMKPHDTAHGATVEKFATEGAVGGLLHLLLWVAAGVVLVRAARGARGPERILILTVGTALAAHFASVQTLFATTVGSLQAYLLLGFVAGLDQRARAGPGTDPRRLRAGPLAAGAAVWCLAGLGLWSNQAILQAASSLQHANSASKTLLLAREQYGQAVAAFEPLANLARLNLFNRFARRLNRRPALLENYLPWLEEQAAAALATEPRNWRLRLAVAQLYSVAAEQDPRYLPRAQEHADRLLDIAPGERGVLGLLGRPGPAAPLTVTAVPDGLRFDWPRRSDVLSYRLTERVPGGRWRKAYEGVASWAVVARRGDERVRFRVRGCLGHGNCGGWSNRVEIDPDSPPPPDDVASSEAS